jgi:hypothetical protein
VVEILGHGDKVILNQYAVSEYPPASSKDRLGYQTDIGPDNILNKPERKT